MHSALQLQKQQNSTQGQNKAFPTVVPVIQKKLDIGASDDPQELEADAMADKIVHQIDVPPIAPLNPKGPLVQKKCSQCEDEEKEGISKPSSTKIIQPTIQRSALAKCTTTETSPEITQQINNSKGAGSPMDTNIRSFMEHGFNADFSKVRIHTDANAVQLSKSLSAQAFAVGNDIYFNQGRYNPNSKTGKHLLAHELTHTLQQGEIIRRQGECPTADMNLSEGQGSYNGDASSDYIIWSAWREGDTFESYVDRAVSNWIRWRYGSGISQETIATIQTYLKRNGVTQLIQAPVDNCIYGQSVPIADVRYVTRLITGSQQERDSGEQNTQSVNNGNEIIRNGDADNNTTQNDTTEVETTERTYAPEFLTQNADGRAYQYPALPAEIRGIKTQPVDGTGVFSMHLDYNQSAPDLLGQASWAFQHTQYRWEVWDVSGVPEIERQTRETEIRQGGLADNTNAGEEVGRLDHVDDNFSRATEQLANRPDEIASDRAEAMAEGRYWDVVANEINEDLFGLEVLSTYGSELLGTAADAFGDDQERSIHWPREGVFVVRCIAYINPGAEEEDPVRAPSVATKIVTVQPVSQISQEAIDAPSAQAAEMELQLALLRLLGEDDPERAMIPALERQLEEARLMSSGSTTSLIRFRLEQKTRELEEARRTSIFLPHGLPDSRVRRLEQDVQKLTDQLSLAQSRAGELAHGNSSAWRVHGVLISRVTGQTYPLLLQISEPYQIDGNRWKCEISDVTSRDGAKYEGIIDATGNIEADKFRAVMEAIEDFNGGAGYGEGSLTLRLPNSGWYRSLSNGSRNITMQSRPRDWAAARTRLEELGTVIALLGLVVTSPALAVAGGVLGASLAAERIARRMENGTFRWDADAVGDMIDIVSAAASITGIGAIGALTRVPKEGGFMLRVTRSTLSGVGAVANVTEEALDVGGVIFANAQIANQLMEINDAVARGEITATAARRQRASAMSSAIQSNGLYFASHLRSNSDAGQNRDNDPNGGRLVDTPNQTDTVPNSPKVTEIRTALNGALADVPMVENPALGNGVHIRYLDGILRIEIGPDTITSRILQHERWVRQLQRYEGVLGMINRLISRVGQLLGLGPGYGTRGFEARLDVEKLRGILRDLESLKQSIEEKANVLNEGNDVEPTRTQELDAINQEIAAITEQLQRHQRDIDSTEAARGVVASDDTTARAEAMRFLDELNGGGSLEGKSITDISDLLTFAASQEGADLNLTDQQRLEIAQSWLDGRLPSAEPAQSSRLSNDELRQSIDSESIRFNGEDWSPSDVQKAKDIVFQILSTHLGGVAPVRMVAGSSQLAVILEDGTTLKIQTNDTWNGSWGTREFDAPILSLGGTDGPMRVGEGWLAYLQPASQGEITSDLAQQFLDAHPEAGDMGTALEAMRQLIVINGEPRLIDYDNM
ncbi:hypothetical protein MHTCC0001_20040 [Flavobacteriaceae bacterium MHTCC 0001]